MSLPAQTQSLSAQSRAELLQLVESSRAVYAGASGDSANIVAALEVADTIAGLRAYFDRPEIQKRILSLMDTPLGFRTDRPPGAKNRRTGEALPQYPWPVVREATIEGLLRGLQLVGNQINIIAGRMYCTREGFDALIRKDPAISDFVPSIGVPVIRTGGAIVPCSATWKQGGVSRSIAAEIPVRTDESSGVDAILGKATRKFLKRCFELMTGNVLPEGDSGEVHTEGGEAPRLGRPPAQQQRIPAGQTQQNAGAGTPPPRGAQTSAPAAKSQQTSTPAAAAVNPATAQAATPPAATADPADPAAAHVANPPAEAVEPWTYQNRLAAEVRAMGYTFDEFREAGIKLGLLAGLEQDAGAFLELTEKTAKRFLNAIGGLRISLEKEFGKRTAPGQGAEEGGAE